MRIDAVERKYKAAAKVRNHFYRLGGLTPVQNEKLKKAIRACSHWQSWLVSYKKAHEEKTEKKNRFCAKCLGKSKRKCGMCGQMRVDDPLEKERLEYLLSTWYKLKRFNMQTTGCPQVDFAIKCEYGDWRYLKEPYLI